MSVSWEVLQGSSKAYGCRQICHHPGAKGFLAGPSVSAQSVTQPQQHAVAWPTPRHLLTTSLMASPFLHRAKPVHDCQRSGGCRYLPATCICLKPPPACPLSPSPPLQLCGQAWVVELGTYLKVTVIQPLAHLPCYHSINSALGLGPVIYSGHHYSCFVLFTYLKHYPSFKGNNTVSQDFPFLTALFIRRLSLKWPNTENDTINYKLLSRKSPLLKTYSYSSYWQTLCTKFPPVFTLWQNIFYPC